MLLGDDQVAVEIAKNRRGGLEVVMLVGSGCDRLWFTVQNSPRVTSP
jgi:hypothetical protein